MMYWTVRPAFVTEARCQVSGFQLGAHVQVCAWGRLSSEFAKQVQCSVTWVLYVCPQVIAQQIQRSEGEMLAMCAFLIQNALDRQIALRRHEIFQVMQYIVARSNIGRYLAPTSVVPNAAQSQTCSILVCHFPTRVYQCSSPPPHNCTYLFFNIVFRPGFVRKFDWLRF